MKMIVCAAITLATLTVSVSVRGELGAPCIVTEERDKPEAWFHIIGGNASKEGISADVKAIADAGIGGIQFFHGQFGGAWPGVKEQIPCLSPKWDGLVAHLADECAAHNLTFKLQNCPGWSMSGGPWVPKEKAMRRLVVFAPGDRPAYDSDDDYHEIGAVIFPMPLGEDIGTLRPDSVETNGDARVMRFANGVCARAVTLSNPGYINHDWCYEPGLRFTLEADGKTVLDRECPQGAWSDAAPMTFAIPETTAHTWRFSVAHQHVIKRYPQVSLTAATRIDNWEAKAGLAQRGLEILSDSRPVATRGTMTLVFGHVNAKRRNHPAPPEATGWECDKMDAAGFEANFNGYIGRLLKGPLAGKKVAGTLVDSWECGVQTWTPKMESEFRRLNGYELRPWLPALFGVVLKSISDTERFLLDWRRTCSRLVEDNYFGTIARLAHENGMMAQYETAFGDVLPGDLMRFWKYADEPMCEFWSPFSNEGFVYSHDFKPVRPCVSAAHIYGKRRVSAESFTSFKLTFDERLGDRKADANVHLCRGLTHLVFQTYTHNPVVGGKPPSSSFGSGIGTPFLREQTWWPFMSGFTRYLAACGHELERGKPVVDVLWYLGDALGHKPSEHGDALGSGYKYDYLNRDALETRVDVNNGRLVLPDGMSYRVLWIPKGTYMLPESERLVSALEKKGVRVVRGDFKPDWAPDVEGAPYWYHRCDGDESIYFLAAFRSPFSGAVKLRDAKSPIAVELAPGEGRFVYVKNGTVIRQVDPESGREIVSRTPCGELSLNDWSRPLGLWCDLPGTREEKGFSGTREYVRRVNRPFPVTDSRRVILDLGRVEGFARVTVNGKCVASLWCEPFKADVTEALNNGENEVRIDVTSTWRNRLIVDDGLPEEKRQTWTIAGPDKGHGFASSGWVGPAKFVFAR